MSSRDDSIKQFSNTPTLHIYNSGKICRVELCTELFYAIIPTLFLCSFADLLSLHLITFLMLFILVFFELGWKESYTTVVAKYFAKTTIWFSH